MTNTTIWLVLALVQSGELVWLVILTAAWIAQRRRHDRLLARVGTLSKDLTKVGRLRHTGSQPAVLPTQTLSNRPPPFPVPPPSTTPMPHPDAPRGRHASP